MHSYASVELFENAQRSGANKKHFTKSLTAPSDELSIDISAAREL